MNVTTLQIPTEHLVTKVTLNMEIHDLAHAQTDIMVMKIHIHVTYDIKPVLNDLGALLINVLNVIPLYYTF